MDQWEQYLFEAHSEETLRSWARRLRLFRFFRAFGGHAGDGDSLDVAYRIRSFEEFEDLMAHLGVSLERYATRPPQPEPGVAYPADIFSTFPSLIPGTSWVRQPGHTVVSEQRSFIWCDLDRVTISLFEGFEVTEATVMGAEAIERPLSSVTLQRIDPPRDTKNYICPRYYPDYFM
ncbi:MAG TPA: hypothetical protein PLH94_11630 [Fimbriimonadaceae bacterium]|nr:hypothetical protein [Fimbriimonadaceae bacterium]